jgi:glutamate racemase
VLGCTHYAFAAQHFHAAVGLGVHLLEPGTAVARHTSQMLQARELVTPVRAPGQTRLLASGNSNALKSAALHWLQA